MSEDRIDPAVMPTAEQAIKFFALQPDTENDPMMLFSNGERLVVTVLNGFPQIGPAIQQILPRFVAEHGKPRWIVVCAEAYMKSYDKADAPAGGHRPGELQERAEAGDPTVIEVVMANGFSADAEFSAIQTFKRKDGEIVYGELNDRTPEGRVQGAVPNAIRPFLR